MPGRVSAAVSIVGVVGGADAGGADVGAGAVGGVDVDAAAVGGTNVARVDVGGVGVETAGDPGDGVDAVAGVSAGPVFVGAGRGAGAGAGGLEGFVPGSRVGRDGFLCVGVDGFAAE